MQEKQSNSNNAFISDELIGDRLSLDDSDLDAWRMYATADIDIVSTMNKSEWDNEFPGADFPQKSHFRLRIMIFQDKSSICLRNDSPIFIEAFTKNIKGKIDKDRAISLSPADTHATLSYLLTKAKSGELKRTSEQTEITEKQVENLFSALGFQKPQERNENIF